jgi:glyoxylase-like metal-dependent hydrolase (beta-lactamase superfamily II)
VGAFALLGNPDRIGLGVLTIAHEMLSRVEQPCTCSAQVLASRGIGLIQGVLTAVVEGRAGIVWLDDPRVDGGLRRPANRQVADGVTRVAGSRTVFYIIDDGSLCLVDAGYPRDLDAIVAAVEDLGRSLADLSAVLLTHAHADHIGSSERLRARHGVPVHTHVEEAPHARGEREERISTGYMLSRLWWPKMLSLVVNVVRAGAASVEPVGELSTFEEAPDGLDLPGRPVPVFTPGHTSGHCSFLLPDRGVLFTGDALVTHDALTQETGPRILHEAFNHDQAETVRSLDRLRTLDANILLPGHGESFHGSPADAVDQALANIA